MSVPGSGSSYPWHSSFLLIAMFSLFVFALSCGGGTKSSGSSGTGGGGGGTGGGNNSSAQEFLYITNGDNSTSAYVLNSNGSLTAVSGLPFSVGGSSLAPDPNGKFLFSLGGTSPSATAVNTDSIGANGAPAVSSTVSDSTLTPPVQMNPNGSTLYVGSIDVSTDSGGFKVYTVQSDGSLQFAAGVISQNARRFAFLSDGSFAYAASCYHFAADIQGFNTSSTATTATSEHVTQVGSSTECPNTVAVTPSGNALAAAWANGDNVGAADNLITLYTISSSSHSLTPAGNPSFPASGVAADSIFDSTGKFFIVAQDDGLAVYQVSQNSVSEIAGSPFAGGTNFNRVVLASSGGFVIAISSQSQQVYVFTLNSMTGALTEASGSPESVTSPTDVAAVEQ